MDGPGRRGGSRPACGDGSGRHRPGPGRSADGQRFQTPEVPRVNIDADYLTLTLADLVRINSINPAFSGAATNEREIADYVTAALERLDLTVSRHEPEAGRLVAAVADEEVASIGMSEVLRHHRADAAIVTEATELAVCVAHKGFCWIEVETHGRAAHGSRRPVP